MAKIYPVRPGLRAAKQVVMSTAFGENFQCSVKTSNVSNFISLTNCIREDQLRKENGSGSIDE